LLYRLSPILIVGIFVSPLLLNNNIGGLLYFIGLFINYLLLYFLLALFNIPGIIDTTGKCTLSTIGYVPITIAIFSYSFSYLLYSIVINNLAIYNIPTIILFCFLIIAELLYSLTNNCSTVFTLLITIMFSMGMGTLFSYVFGQGNVNGNEYRMNSDNQSRLMPGETTSYRCDTYDDNGNLVQT